MTLNLCLKMLPMEIILELVITANQNIFWVSLQCVDIDLKPTDTFFKPCLVFLSYFLLFLEANIKPTELCITLLVLQAIFVASKCTSLLLCWKSVHRSYRSFFQNFKKDRKIRVKMHKEHINKQWKLLLVLEYIRRWFLISERWLLFRKSPGQSFEFSYD